MPWDVRLENGVYLPQIGWWLDARQPVPRAFVSHAHFDHVAAHARFLCSEGTARLTRARLPGARDEIVLPFGQPHALTPDCTVRLHPAGHILGSAQFHATGPQGTLLYTGDFKLRPGLSAEPCATPAAETLVMETTFGLPRYVFPPTAEVVAEIVAFCQQAIHDAAVPVLFGYSLGKSQEVLRALGGAGLPVMLHPEVHRLTEVCAGLGVGFPPYAPFDPFTCAGHVVLCPPQAANSAFLRRIEHRRTAMVTGWAMDPGARFRYQCDAAFPLSDHADHADLLTFVERVAPRRVLTLHGFAREFAATLRARGVEAWALGQDNQLDLPVSVAGADLPPHAGQAEEPPPADPGPATLAAWGATADRVAALPGRTAKTAALRDHLAALPDDDAAAAAVHFTGRPFPAADDRPLGAGWALLRRALVAAAGATEAEFRAVHARLRDGGAAAEAVFRAHGRTGPGLALAEFGAALAAVAADRTPAGKLARLEALFRRLAPAEARHALRIVTGDLRIGLKDGLVEEAVAAATGTTPEDIRAAHLLCGDLGSVLRHARRGRLAEIRLRPLRPLQCMLASPEPTAGAILQRLGAPVWLEDKYDGIRCHVHKVGREVELFSRDLRRLTAQFPELAAGVAQLPADFVADGELLAWRDGRALPFAALQRRLGRRGDDLFLGAEIPVALSLFDVLWVDGHPLLDRPLRERRGHLEHLVPADHPVLRLSPVTRAATALEITAAFQRARARGNEGLMAKDPGSPYTPGRRGLAWLKLKEALATLDVAVVAAEFGHGRRREVLSDYTFAVRDDATGALRTVGKAYTGLTDAEIAALTARLLAATRAVRGRVHEVAPEVVLEVAFDRIQPSARHASGYALRFPRIVRVREDKTVADIDTLDTCRRLAGAPPAAV